MKFGKYSRGFCEVLVRILDFINYSVFFIRVIIVYLLCKDNISIFINDCIYSFYVFGI